jgi:hypothetical protein
VDRSNSGTCLRVGFDFKGAEVSDSIYREWLDLGRLLVQHVL